MFKKIALLAGAGALAFGAVAPMAAATPSDLSQATCDQASGASHQASVNTVNAGLAVKKAMKNQAKAKAKYTAAAAKLNAATTAQRDAKKTYDKAVGNTKEAEGKAKAKAQKAESDALDALNEANADLTAARTAYFSARTSYYTAMSYTVMKNTEKNLKAERYNEILTTIAACKANNFEVAKITENCDDAAAAFANAKSVSDGAMSIAKDARANLSDAKKVGGAYAAAAAKEAIGDFQSAAKNADKVAADANVAKYSAFKDMARICGINSNGKMVNAKKVGDNKVNNAAAKEGHNGLAATGSAASVAALLSALAVLAGGAFVGIRRFNS